MKYIYVNNLRIKNKFWKPNILSQLESQLTELHGMDGKQPGESTILFLQIFVHWKGSSSYLHSIYPLLKISYDNHIELHIA